MRQLTKQETNILGLACSGLKNFEIANRLGIAKSTVDSALYSAYNKLNARNRIEAVLKALRFGLITTS